MLPLRCTDIEPNRSASHRDVALQPRNLPVERSEASDGNGRRRKTRRYISKYRALGYGRLEMRPVNAARNTADTGEVEEGSARYPSLRIASWPTVPGVNKIDRLDIELCLDASLKYRTACVPKRF